jgi:hypothetical protein
MSGGSGGAVIGYLAWSGQSQCDRSGRCDWIRPLDLSVTTERILDCVQTQVLTFVTVGAVSASKSCRSCAAKPPSPFTAWTIQAGRLVEPRRSAPDTAIAGDYRVHAVEHCTAK